MVRKRKVLIYLSPVLKAIADYTKRIFISTQNAVRKASSARLFACSHTFVYAPRAYFTGAYVEINLHSVKILK